MNLSLCIKSFSNSLLRSPTSLSDSALLSRTLLSKCGFADAAGSTESVKELRRRTSAGYMDCKKALGECGGDIDKAVEFLRKKGMLKAAAKADRSTAEGVVAIAHNPSSPNLGLVLEMNSETDFVSRGSSFSDLASKIAQVGLKHVNQIPIGELRSGKIIDPEEIKKLSFSTSGTVADAIKETIGKLGENIQLRRVYAVGVPNGEGAVGTYVHRTQGTPENGVTLGGLGALVLLESASSNAAIGQLANKLAQHIVGFSPEYVKREDITEADWERHREKYLKKQAELHENVPKLSKKQFEDRLAPDLCLMEQEGVSGSKISQMIADASKAGAAPVKVSLFKKFVVGEGMEKKEVNFAEEVQKLARGN